MKYLLNNTGQSSRFIFHEGDPIPELSLEEQSNLTTQVLDLYQEPEIEGQSWSHNFNALGRNLTLFVKKEMGGKYKSGFRLRQTQHPVWGEEKDTPEEAIKSLEDTLTKPGIPENDIPPILKALLTQTATKITTVTDA